MSCVEKKWTTGAQSVDNYRSGSKSFWGTFALSIPEQYTFWISQKKSQKILRIGSHQNGFPLPMLTCGGRTRPRRISPEDWRTKQFVCGVPEKFYPRSEELRWRVCIQKKP
jgi:hypothetical protein